MGFIGRPHRRHLDDVDNSVEPSARMRSPQPCAPGLGISVPRRHTRSLALVTLAGRRRDRAAFRRVTLMSKGLDLISLIASRQNLDDYQKKHWSGSFAEYLDILKNDPNVTRTAYQR